MEMRPSVAHGLGGASDPGPAPNRSMGVQKRRTRCRACFGCSYKVPGALERHLTRKIDLKCSCLVGVRPESLASYPAVRAVEEGESAV